MLPAHIEARSVGRVQPGDCGHAEVSEVVEWFLNNFGTLTNHHLDAEEPHLSPGAAVSPLEGLRPDPR